MSSYAKDGKLIQGVTLRQRLMKDTLARKFDDGPNRVRFSWFGYVNVLLDAYSDADAPRKLLRVQDTSVAPSRQMVAALRQSLHKNPAKKEEG